ncbi:hypothetical protein [Nocardia stercoris]|uniref:Uncharacterized protein n=1 Tax=Nocardia stercoris TaxID=2483361 RepID=A0A3M2L7C7_9NOCA|nr:hypothetical protein [Nocardia stercoris]RMI32896.1 hypothetical protein EBN03_13335 [Nocardia stercoris]
MHSFADWWDGFELWVAGLPFVPQFAVVLFGMIPVSIGLAMGLDFVLRSVLHLLGRDRAAVAAPAEAAAAATVRKEAA